MTSLLAFALAVIAILATPGPTNTLLMTGGCTSGWRAFALLPAELVGYLTAVLLWRLTIEPIATQGAIMTAVKLGAGLYLLFVASRVWLRKSGATLKNQVVRIHEVGFATLMNPKALIFALVVFPAPPADVGMHFALFAILVPLLGACWTGLGLVVGSNIRQERHSLILQRFGAVMTGAFATGIIATTVA
jgi:threonine/homoserine/homoserine lactone efflux protein